MRKSPLVTETAAALVPLVATLGSLVAKGTGYTLGTLVTALGTLVTDETTPRLGAFVREHARARAVPLVPAGGRHSSDIYLFSFPSRCSEYYEYIDDIVTCNRNQSPVCLREGSLRDRKSVDGAICQSELFFPSPLSLSLSLCLSVSILSARSVDTFLNGEETRNSKVDSQSTALCEVVRSIDISRFNGSTNPPSIRSGPFGNVNGARHQLTCYHLSVAKITRG